MNDSDRQDRIAGVLLGQAAGDALGSPYEFRAPPARGQARFGRGTFGHAPAQYTDDTEQACCVVMAKSDPLKAAANLLQWYAGNPLDAGGQTRAVMSRAKTPRGLLAASKAYARQQESTPRPAGWDPGSGNGALMRTGPVCLPMIGDRKRIAATARKVSALTHADVWSQDACCIWSLAIDSAIGGADPAGMTYAEWLEFVPAARRGYWRKVIGEALSGPRPSGQNGSAVGAFRCALYAVAHADDLADGLQLAVSLGGDADTVAAIAGSLLGARFGASAVPDKWRRKVWGWPGMKAAGLERLALDAAGCSARTASSGTDS